MSSSRESKSKDKESIVGANTQRLLSLIAGISAGSGVYGFFDFIRDKSPEPDDSWKAAIDYIIYSLSFFTVALLYVKTRKKLGVSIEELDSRQEAMQELQNEMKRMSDENIQMKLQLRALKETGRREVSARRILLKQSETLSKVVLGAQNIVPISDEDKVTLTRRMGKIQNEIEDDRGWVLLRGGRKDSTEQAGKRKHKRRNSEPSASPSTTIVGQSPRPSLRGVSAKRQLDFGDEPDFVDLEAQYGPGDSKRSAAGIELGSGLGLPPLRKQQNTSGPKLFDKSKSATQQEAVREPLLSPVAKVFARLAGSWKG